MNNNVAQMTDEQISAVYYETLNGDGGSWYIRYARAILAQAAPPAAPAQQDEREAFEAVIRSLTDPKSHHYDLARDERAHDVYARWPTALAWEAWRARAALKGE